TSFAAMREQAQSLGAIRASGLARIVSEGMSDLRGATAPRLQLELLCARLLLPADAAHPAGPGASGSRTPSGAAAAPATTGAGSPTPTSGAPAAPAASSAPAAAAADAPTAGHASESAAVPAPAGSQTAAAAEASSPATAPTRTTGQPSQSPAVAPQPPATAPSRTRSAPPPPPAISTVTSGTASAPAANPVAAASESAPRADSAGLAAVAAAWAGVVEAIGTQSKVSWSLLNGSRAVVAADVLQVVLPTAPLVANARQRGLDEVVRAAVRAQFGIDVRVDFAAGSGPASAPDDIAGARDDDDVVASGPVGVEAVTKLLGGTVISEFETNDQP
ncbi:MAG: hypothetical protein KGP01_02545, partial [Actinomycetales bacterium]|nr:hypothetical protein [Actinomycetales bacterium]